MARSGKGISRRVRVARPDHAAGPPGSSAPPIATPMISQTYGPTALGAERKDTEEALRRVESSTLSVGFYDIVN